MGKYTEIRHTNVATRADAASHFGQNTDKFRSPHAEQGGSSRSKDCPQFPHVRSEVGRWARIFLANAEIWETSHGPDQGDATNYESDNLQVHRRLLLGALRPLSVQTSQFVRQGPTGRQSRRLPLRMPSPRVSQPALTWSRGRVHDERTVEQAAGVAVFPSRWLREKSAPGGWSSAANRLRVLPPSRSKGLQHLS